MVGGVSREPGPPRQSPFGPEGPPLGFLVASVGAGTMAAFRAALAPHGVHPRQFALLRALAASDGQSQQELSRSLHVPPGRMVPLVDDLQGRGLLERRPSAGDRRVRTLHLTRPGRALLAELRRAAGEHEKRMFASLSPVDQEQLKALLGQVAGALGLQSGEHPGMSAEV